MVPPYYIENRSRPAAFVGRKLYKEEEINERGTFGEQSSPGGGPVVVDPCQQKAHVCGWIRRNGSMGDFVVILPSGSPKKLK